MKRNTMALTALGLGAAYLMRNKNSRDKLKTQFSEFSKGGNGNGGLMDSVMNSMGKNKTTSHA